MRLNIYIFITVFLSLSCYSFGQIEKKKLENLGIDVEFVYTSDIFSNISGGIEEKTGYLNNIDLVFSFDFEKMWGIEGLTGNLYFLSNHGDDPTEYMGDIQTASNIETDRASRIYEAWIQKEFQNGKFSILFGLFDLNSEFDTTETGGYFINSSHGIGPDFSQSGENGPSIFPVTSLALRFRVNFENKLYFTTAIFDSVPGSLHNPHGTHIKVNSDEGYLISTEFGYLNEEKGSKLALGTWLYTKDFEILENPLEEKTSKGFYLLGERKLISGKNEGKGLFGFFRIGMAEDKVNPIDWYLGCGLVYKGVFFSSEKDSLGLAFANAHLGTPFKNINLSENLNLDNSELNIELSYSLQLNDWFRIQPDIQYVINPGMDPNLKNSFAFFLRTEFAF